LGGEPENLVAVCKILREQHKMGHVGIVYNLHHGHEHIDDFEASLARMKPYLLCLNLNGMNAKGPKILQLSAGEADVKLLKIIVASGYSGPTGLIGHTGDDVELRLRDNLDGLDWILPQLSGTPPAPARPIARNDAPLVVGKLNRHRREGLSPSSRILVRSALRGKSFQVSARSCRVSAAASLCRHVPLPPRPPPPRLAAAASRRRRVSRVDRCHRNA